MKSEEFVEIGKLQKPHGIKGEIVATIDADIDLEQLTYIVTVIDGLNVPFFINSLRPRSSESVLLTLDGIDNERDAAELSLLPVMVRKSDMANLGLEPDDETDGMSAADLISYTLIDEGSGNEPVTVGTIEDIKEITADNWIFEVKTPDGRMIMVPIADELITDIDTDTKHVTMNLPVGLSDL